MAKPLTHQDWDIIGTALGHYETLLEGQVDLDVKGAARRLAQAEATARKADAMFLETYPETPASTVDDGATKGETNG